MGFRAGAASATPRRCSGGGTTTPRRLGPTTLLAGEASALRWVECSEPFVPRALGDGAAQRLVPVTPVAPAERRREVLRGLTGLPQRDYALRLGRAVAAAHDAAHDVVTRLYPALGAPDALRYLLARAWTRFKDSVRLVVLHPRQAEFPLLCRLGTSDLDNFDQIFVEREYAPLDDLDDVALVVDCGAYVGYSASYLLSQFPRSKLIALEPNSENCRLLRRNLAAYAKRVDVIEAAVWSGSANLAAAADQYRDGREWTFHVREAETNDEATIPALGIADILRRSGMTSISLLKMDIEGAEIGVFSNGVEGWIDAVETLVIELHDDSPYGAATPVVAAVLQHHGFVASRSGEVTIFRRA
jgi:FkbM family methyltransferase